MTGFTSMDRKGHRRGSRYIRFLRIALAVLPSAASLPLRSVLSRTVLSVGFSRFSAQSILSGRHSI